MIHYTSGNIFDAKVDAIVNTVNTEGIMGKGLALQFKKKFPENFKAYAHACKHGEVRIGRMFVYAHNDLSGLKYLINFPTKTTWKSKSRLEAITLGLEALRSEIERLKIKKIAIPPLGCGLGGLPWQKVRTAMEHALSTVQNVDIIIYTPQQTVNPTTEQPREHPSLTPARALLLRCYARYMSLVPSVTLTFVEAHKLAYMLQHVCAVPLRLNFRTWKYGPYAHNLSHVLAHMEGVWIEGWGDGTRGAFDAMHLLPAARAADTFPLPEEYETALSNVDAFFSGFETPTGLELLATVHWLVTRMNIPPANDDVRRAIASWGCPEHPEWGRRKERLFSSASLGMALQRVLKEQAIT